MLVSIFLKLYQKTELKKTTGVLNALADVNMLFDNELVSDLKEY